MHQTGTLTATGMDHTALGPRACTCNRRISAVTPRRPMHLICAPSLQLTNTAQLALPPRAAPGPPCPCSPSPSAPARRSHHSSRAISCAAGKKEASSSAGSPQQGAKAPQSNNQQEVEEEEDGFLLQGDDEFDDDEYEGEEFGDEGEEGESGEGEDDEDDYAAVLGLELDDTRPGVDVTGGGGWAEGALKATNRVLALPPMANIKLYVFRALPGGKLDIRLDRLDDPYGSPSIDDIEKFSRMLFLELDAELGVEAAADVSLEVSSPGAERTLELPGDLTRFAGLPLYVEYTNTEDKLVTAVMIMDAWDQTSGLSQWRLADVRANAPAKGRGLSKRQREMQIQVQVASIKLARVYVDF